MTTTAQPPHGGSSRRDLLRATAAATALGAFAAIPARALRAQATGNAVVDVLNFALTLEYVDGTLYAIATGAEPLPAQYGTQVTLFNTGSVLPRGVVEELAENEQGQIAALQEAIRARGGTPVARPVIDFTGGRGAVSNGRFTGPFQDVFTNPQTFLALAQAFEDLGVRAYKGGAPLLVSDLGALELALQIHSMEARHAAKVRRLRGEDGWISGRASTLPAALQGIYGPGSPPANFPAEDNTVQAGVNVATLANAGGAGIAAESFDEPLDQATVLALAAPFLGSRAA